MGVREILQLPHPLLRQRARKVRTIDSAILHLAYDMVETMQQANGVGLAANQVGELKRIITIQLPEEDEVRIYINPEIVQRDGERRVEEGCLSIAGYKGMVTRSVWVKFRALDSESAVVKLKAEDLLAQALEHEVDHLNGILYIDHMESHEKLVKVEPEEGQKDDNPTDDTAESEPLSKTDSGIWIPAEDGRNTPASLKVK